MRKRTLITTILLGAYLFVSAQDGCNTFFPFTEGTVMSYASYDKKGQLASTVTHKVAFVDDTDTGGLTARVETNISDEKGNEQITQNYKVSCAGDEVTFDLISMMSPQMTEAFSSMEVSVSGDGLRLPASLSVGQNLPEATTQVKAGTGGMNLLNMTFTVSERKVEARETITTAAGTFDCFKIRYTMDSKMLITKSFEVVEWFSPGFGLIRSETYNKKGKLEGSTELTAFTRP